jgi:type II secretory pathway component PulJ
MWHKLHSSRGETLIEALVATLIVSLSLLMLANALTDVQRILSTSNQRMVDYYHGNDVVARKAVSGTSGLAGKLRLYYKEGAEEHTLVSHEVYYFRNDTFAERPIVSYRKK